jgi:hypothetical protein
VYDLVRYTTGASEGAQWVTRGNTISAQQPFVGPLESDNALRFRYFAANSATPMATPPGTTGTQLRQVSRIRVVVAARSRGSSGATQQVERDSVTVFLRNQ